MLWCIESAFNSVEGVEKAISGYAGGEKADPTYEEVCKEILAMLKWYK